MLKGTRVYRLAIAFAAFVAFAPISGFAQQSNYPPSGGTSDTTTSRHSSECTLAGSATGFNSCSGPIIQDQSTSAAYPVARVDAGQSLWPVDAWNKCRYVTNNSATRAHPLFYKDSNQWDHTINSQTGDMIFTTCARPWTPPAPAPDTTSGSPTYCGAAPTLTVGPLPLPYAPTSNNPSSAVTVTAQYACSCASGSSWTQTASQKYIPGISPDLPVSNPAWNSGWVASGNVTYSATKPPGCDVTQCAATSLNWTVGSNSCTGPAPTTNGGSSTTVSATGLNSGAAVFDCQSSGSWSPTPRPGATCSYICSPSGTTTTTTDACSASCGGGTQTVTIYDSCGSTISSASQACNTQACSTAACAQVGYLGPGVWCAERVCAQGNTQTLLGRITRTLPTPLSMWAQCSATYLCVGNDGTSITCDVTGDTQ